MTVRPAYRIQAYWQGRRARRDEIAAQLWQFVGALPWASPRLRALVPHSKEGELLPPLESAAQAESLLAHWTVRWRTGGVEHTSYQVPLVLGGVDAPAVRCELVAGLEAPAVEGLWVPNRLSLTVQADAPDGLAGRDVLLAMLHAAVRVFDPDWGVVAIEGSPVLPRPLYSRGEPVAGWMTYLSRRFPLAGLAVSEPSAVYSVGEQGYLVISYAEAPRADSAAQRAATAGVHHAMRAAGIVTA